MLALLLSSKDVSYINLKGNNNISTLKPEVFVDVSYINLKGNNNDSLIRAISDWMLVILIFRESQYTSFMVGDYYDIIY